MAAPSQTREVVPGNTYYMPLCKAFHYEGDPITMVWAGVKWTRVRRNDREIFINAGLQSDFDRATSGNSIGYNGGTGDVSGPGLPEGPGITPIEGLSVANQNVIAAFGAALGVKVGFPVTEKKPNIVRVLGDGVMAEVRRDTTDGIVFLEHLDETLKTTEACYDKAVQLLDGVDPQAKVITTEAVPVPVVDYDSMTDYQLRTLLWNRGHEPRRGHSPDDYRAKIIADLRKVDAESAANVIEPAHVRDVVGFRPLYEAMSDGHLWDVTFAREGMRNFNGGRIDLENANVDWEYAHLGDHAVMQWRYDEIAGVNQNGGPSFEDQVAIDRQRIADADPVTDRLPVPGSLGDQMLRVMTASPTLRPTPSDNTDATHHLVPAPHLDAMFDAVRIASDNTDAERLEDWDAEAVLAEAEHMPDEPSERHAPTVDVHLAQLTEDEVNGTLGAIIRQTRIAPTVEEETVFPPPKPPTARQTAAAKRKAATPA